MKRTLFALLFPLLFVAFAEDRTHPDLQRELETLARAVDGRVGVCVRDARGEACVNGDGRFPMQSVMKLPVGIAIMDAVDRKGWRLDERLLVRKQDLSLFVQPLAKLVTEKGWETTLGDLVHRAIVDSDSAATDILIAKLGGPPAVQACLERLGVKGVRVDRDERHLQTEVFGLVWRPAYVDVAALDRAIEQVPKARREQAFRAYRADLRDTATPRGMADLLRALTEGRLLSAASTKHLMGVMQQTVTFSDRLKAGMAAGWTLGHKTGTSNTWDGVTAATNDVGVLTAPEGGTIAVAVFIADSTAASAERAAVMARIAAAAIRNYGAQ